MILSSSSLSTHSTLTQAFLTLKTLFNRSLPGWLLISLLVTPLTLNSCSSDSKTNLSKYATLQLTPPSMLKILVLSLTNILPSLSKACYYHIRQLRCFRHYLDSSTACIIATSIVHSKLDYCNSLYYKLSKSQLSRLQQIQNLFAHTAVTAPKSCHITHILCSLHWPRITERIEYQVLSLTYEVLTTISNLHTFITSSLLNVFAVLALHSSLLLIGHLYYFL